MTCEEWTSKAQRRVRKIFFLIIRSGLGALEGMGLEAAQIREEKRVCDMRVEI